MKDCSHGLIGVIPGVVLYRGWRFSWMGTFHQDGSAWISWSLTTDFAVFEHHRLDIVVSVLASFLGGV